MKNFSISILFTLTITSLQAQEQCGIVENELIGKWKAETVVGHEDNMIWFNDLVEYRLNDDRNMMIMPAFEIEFKDSIFILVHSDTTHHIQYVYDEDCKAIDFDFKGSTNRMKFSWVSSKDRTMVILRNNEDGTMILLEESTGKKKKRKKKK